MSQTEITYGAANRQRPDYSFAIQAELYTPQSQDRLAVEHYVAQKYLDVHNAHIHHFLPILVSVGQQQTPLGAFGLRPGHCRPMFLEQYLNSPIEQQVAAITRQPVDRCSLVEVGNLVVTQKGIGPLVMLVLAMSLADAGFEWMVFTVTDQVTKLMKRLGFEPHYLVSANPDRLEGDKSLWGSYYQNNPKVMVGSLSVAREVIVGNSRLSALVDQNAHAIKTVSNGLRDYRPLRGDR